MKSRAEIKVCKRYTLPSTPWESVRGAHQTLFEQLLSLVKDRASDLALHNAFHAPVYLLLFYPRKRNTSFPFPTTRSNRSSRAEQQELVSQRRGQHPRSFRCFKNRSLAQIPAPHQEKNAYYHKSLRITSPGLSISQCPVLNAHLAGASLPKSGSCFRTSIHVAACPTHQRKTERDLTAIARRSKADHDWSWFANRTQLPSNT